MGVSYKIVNLVATISIHQNLSLQEIANIPYVIHDIEIYGGRAAYYKSPNMYGTVAIFSTGKIISMGTKSQFQAKSDLGLTLNILRKSGLIENFKIIMKINNIVALVDFKKKIDLGKLAKKLNIPYITDRFNRINYKIYKPNATFLIFESGKIIITGIKNTNNLETALKIIKEKLLI